MLIAPAPWHQLKGTSQLKGAHGSASQESDITEL